ncbi:MAG: IPExxxVDY family protein [Saprospiraceae bacterium]|nr:IPExxxVDY family protein [Saprospiraceae bacterium]
MKKKLLLDFEPSEENNLIGISSHLKDYRLSFYINKALGFQFKKIDDLVIHNGTENNGKSFSLYYFDYTENYVQFFLIENRNPNGVLISEFKHFDYFIFINGALNIDKTSTLIKSIRSCDGVLMVSEIDISTIKKLQNILSDLELHMMKLNKDEKEKTKLKLKTKV